MNYGKIYELKSGQSFPSINKACEVLGIKKTRMYDKLRELNLRSKNDKNFVLNFGTYLISNNPNLKAIPEAPEEVNVEKEMKKEFIDNRKKLVGTVTRKKSELELTEVKKEEKPSNFEILTSQNGSVFLLKNDEIVKKCTTAKELLEMIEVKGIKENKED